MQAAGAACGAFDESVVFLSYFNDLPDPRQRGKVNYPLPEILLASLFAILAGADGFSDIANFGRQKIELLRRFLPFKHGTPSHDHLGDIFASLDAEIFQRCFVRWVAAVTGLPSDVVAIDGKTSRRSFRRKGQSTPLHTVSAFAARQRLVLGQVKVDAKANEIVAIPKLLDMLEIEGAVVTIDAMGCQRAIAQKIIDKKADYILALKGNQANLKDDVELFVAEQEVNDFKDTAITRAETVDGEHGRIETRKTTVIHDVAWVQDLHQWPDLKGIVIVESIRELDGKIETETRLYITSLLLLAAQIGGYVRDHWAIENSLHWVMDMTFRDDERRIRKDNAPANFVTMQHMAHNVLRRGKGKHSLRTSRKLAAWNEDFLVGLLAA